MERDTRSLSTWIHLCLKPYQPLGLMTTSLKEIQQKSRLASGKPDCPTLH